ncbi:hypothetical protein [Streptomyces sp. ITFR-16]|uniref:hypothetical protein n=1 Tax=Streptomyces sp. ITFR-16 TaxID=3075198 RepID=UPI00288B04D2|nr:hypothetical protein [Streptomyces sp. ITFR-16]WNI20767.1 hypothetical protein RLT58_02030 [Streptomyces sp. ITFR-16]
MNRRVPTIGDLFPAAKRARSPFDVVIGRDFETACLPEPAARRLLGLCAHLRPHPVGAAIARGGHWVLILPPGSGYGVRWPRPVCHQDTGALAVPPLAAGPGTAPHWARHGNDEGRVFTAPLHLHAVLPLLG